MKNNFLELAFVCIAALAPQFILAKEVDGDEFAKATSGIALAGVVLTIYRVWKGNKISKQD